MPLETEIKLPGADHAALRESLQAMGAVCKGRVFESNRVYDTPDRSLKARGVLLRLREKGDAAVLTLKLPPDAQSRREAEGFKVWDERETAVADAAAMAAVLEGLGYVVAFAYEKFRETWALEWPAGGGEGVEVCLDTLPFGDFVELEGAPGAVEAALARLGLAGAPRSAASYYELHRQWREAQGLQCATGDEDAAESFLFTDRARAALMARD